jgi:hypothetical protein
MKTENLLKTHISLVKKWRIRISVVALLSALMTFTSPFAPIKAPSLDGISAEADEPDYHEYAAQMAWQFYGWNEYQFNCLDQIWTKESHWNPLADNPTSSAFGIAQMLKEDSRDGYEQIRNGLRYVQHRYDDPCNAWSFWKRNKYY